MKHLNALNARVQRREFKQTNPQKPPKRKNPKMAKNTFEFTLGMIEMSQWGRVAQPPMSREEELTRALQRTRDALKQQTAVINGLNEAPKIIATVLHMSGAKRGIVSTGGAPVEVNLPDGCQIGDQIHLVAQTQQGLSKLDKPVVFGRTVTVASATAHEITFDGPDGEQSAALRAGLKAEPGERVKLDPTGKVALVNIGRDTKRFTVTQEQTITWDDIGGLEDAKEALREAIEYPILYADTYAAYGQKPSKGALLYGPAGCGKTLLAKAAAHSVGAGDGFIYIKGAELLSKWVGEGETQVKSVFERARAYRRQSGRAAVIFIDEADAVLGARGAIGASLQSHLVPSFLAEMDGLDDSGAFIILGTNRPNALDPAIVRDGRIDRRVRVGRPDRASAFEIFRLSLRGRPCSEGGILEHGVSELFSDRWRLYELAFESTNVEHIRMRDLLNGALIAGVVSRAAQLAIHRDRRSGERSGITSGDVSRAVADSFSELREVNHFDAIAEKIETVGHIPTSIRKATNAGSEEARFSITVPYQYAGVQGAGGGAAN